ncbi:hypothetical protein [Ekhidna sp.]|uniref:hypothetical protein n=1 Tax=Ekhidna sp. TaxID=2608089 RepID=UPI0032972E5D
MKKNLVYISFLTSAFFLISCGGGKKANEESSAEKKEEIESFVEKEFTYPLPTAFEVSQMLGNANTTYSPDIVNDPSKADQYVATWQKAANLGVYGADLSYAATFDKTQETIDFLDVSKKLIDDLNITSAFNVSMAQRIENNMDNIDSLIFIVTESFYDTYNYLNQNGEEKTSILVIAGSVIEGLHITCELVKMSENKGELMAVLANQKAQVVKLVELMENHQDDENVSKVLPNLRYINLVYDQLGDGTEMTEGQFNDIANSVKEMRDHIVG